MSQVQEKIAQFQKMAADDPENELGHFRLGQLFMEDGQLDEAISSFRRTLVLSPQFSKVYQLLASCLLKLSKQDDALKVLEQGFAVADERGDNMPRDEMAKMLTQLGKSPPASKRPAGGNETGFRCSRPGCMVGSYAKPMTKAPFGDELGQRIMTTVCADCWTDWLKNYSVKVINELRLDLSTERGQSEYDRYMREFFGVE